MSRPPPETCANCGAAIPRTAHACPECGADERIGWREESPEDGLDLPEGYDDEAGDRRNAMPSRRTVNGLAWYWWIAGIMLVTLLILGAVKFR